MAKKATNTFSFMDIVGLTNGLIKNTAIIREDEKTASDRGTIGTGIYVLNAAMSGDIYGGISDNRITVLGGESGCLFPTEKINMYVMRTVKKNHKIYVNTDTETL